MKIDALHSLIKQADADRNRMVAEHRRNVGLVDRPVVSHDARNIQTHQNRVAAGLENPDPRYFGGKMPSQQQVSTMQRNHQQQSRLNAQYLDNFRNTNPVGYYATMFAPVTVGAAAGATVAGALNPVAAGQVARTAWNPFRHLATKGLAGRVGASAGRAATLGAPATRVALKATGYWKQIPDSWAKRNFANLGWLSIPSAATRLAEYGAGRWLSSHPEQASMLGKQLVQRTAKAVENISEPDNTARGYIPGMSRTGGEALARGVQEGVFDLAKEKASPVVVDKGRQLAREGIERWEGIPDWQKDMARLGLDAGTYWLRHRTDGEGVPQEAENGGGN